jgi:hypothetical protein
VKKTNDFTGTFDLELEDDEEDNQAIGSKTINPKAGSPMNYKYSEEERKKSSSLSASKPPRSDEKAKTVVNRELSPL